MNNLKKSFLGSPHGIRKYIPRGKRNLDLDKLGVPLEELKRLRTFPGSPHVLLNDVSEQIITHSRAKRCLRR